VITIRALAWREHAKTRGRIVTVPELPEVESLARFLRQRADGHVIDRADSAAISVLKTYRPDLSALHGRVISDTQRHGKFLDLVAVPAPGADGGQAAGGSQPAEASQPGEASRPADGPLHLVIHLARAGWLRWRDDLPVAPPKPGKGPLGFRLRFTDGAGFDLTEAGTKKRLAVYLVADPAEVPGVAALGPDPMADSFTVEALAGMLAGRRMQIKGVLRDQKIIAGIGNAYSDEVLHVARMSPFKLASSLTDDEVAGLHAAITSTLREAVERSAGLAAGDLKAEKKSGLRVHGRAGEACPVCGDTVREVSFADSALQYCPTCQTGGKPLADRRMSRLLR
jgi:formamidopyrimidine-DNA glycosylase